ncbi:MAG: hypothetical protein WCW47_00915 [Candidatus Paceibacterota bacterium]|jgi:hypothetical protein
MNDQEIDNFINTLSKPVKEFIFAGVWEERTAEIAKKYSLNDTQVNDLVDTVLFVLTGLESPEALLETIIAELGISRLLAEQIMDDLEIRVFEYAVKSIEKKTDSSQQLASSSQEEIQSQNNQNKTPEKDIPEIRPKNLPEIEANILPMTEPGEKVRIVEQPINTVKPETKPQETPGEAPGQTSRPSEIIYKAVPEPIPVPQYTEAPVENKVMPALETEAKPSEPTPTLRPSTLEVGEPTENVGSKPPEPVPPPVKKYAVDPYREPLE